MRLGNVKGVPLAGVNVPLVGLFFLLATTKFKIVLSQTPVILSACTLCRTSGGIGERPGEGCEATEIRPRSNRKIIHQASEIWPVQSTRPLGMTRRHPLGNHTTAAKPLGGDGGPTAPLPERCDACDYLA